MLFKNPRILNTRDYLSSPPVGLTSEKGNQLFKPGFHVLLDLDFDRRCGLKLALDIATGRTVVTPKGRPSVLLLTPKAKWPAGIPDISSKLMGSDVRPEFRIEFVDPTKKELMSDAFRRWMRAPRPDVIVLDAFKPVRRANMTVDAIADSWTKALGVVMFGVAG